MVINLRLWMVDVLLSWVRRLHPKAKSNDSVWQIIEVPRRISQTEADELARKVENL